MVTIHKHVSKKKAKAAIGLDKKEVNQNGQLRVNFLEVFKEFQAL